MVAISDTVHTLSSGAVATISAMSPGVHIYIKSSSAERGGVATISDLCSEPQAKLAQVIKTHPFLPQIRLSQHFVSISGPFLRILFQNSSSIFTFRACVLKRHISIYACIYTDFEH